MEQITIYVPGAENGGFDRTAVAIKRALVKEGLVKDVELIRSPGAGGLVALAQFASRQPEAKPSLIVGGQSILGATHYNRASVSLRDVVPIARMNGIPLVMVVRADSPIRNWQDLSDVMRSNAKEIKWVGGSEGSAASQLLTRLSNHLKTAPNNIVYTAVPGGGDTVAERILDGSHLVAIARYEELSENLSNGKLRAIAVSNDVPVQGLAAQTLKQQGVDVSFGDWKGVFARPGSTKKQQQEFIAIFSELVASTSWKEELQAHRWNDNFSAGAPFAAFVDAEDAKLKLQIQKTFGNENAVGNIASILSGPYRYGVIIALIASLVLAVLSIVYFVNQRKAVLREASLREELDQKEAALAEIINNSTETSLANVTTLINTQFCRWTLSETEKDIAWLVLKGFSFLEIAELRSRSERTVRQQAGAIYTKSGMRSRAELSAFFLEDLFDS